MVKIINKKAPVRVLFCYLGERGRDGFVISVSAGETAQGGGGDLFVLGFYAVWQYRFYLHRLKEEAKKWI